MKDLSVAFPGNPAGWICCLAIRFPAQAIWTEVHVQSCAVAQQLTVLALGIEGEPGTAFIIRTLKIKK